MPIEGAIHLRSHSIPLSELNWYILSVLLALTVAYSTEDLLLNITDSDLAIEEGITISNYNYIGHTTGGHSYMFDDRKSHGIILRYRSLNFQSQKYCQKVKFEVLVFL